MRTFARRALVAAAVLALVATGSACSKKNDSGARPGQLTITIDYFGDFGYADLIKEYERSHPGIHVQIRSVEKLDDYKPKLAQWLAAGTGAGDVVGLEEGILNEFKTQSQNFVNLFDHGAGDLRNDFLGWKWEGGTTADGKQLIGLPTDVGGLAMCYRRDLFAKAGLPSDREAVSQLWPTWEQFIATGQRFTAANTGAKGFVDSVTTPFNAIMFQSGDTNFYDRSGALAAESSPAVRRSWDLSMKMISDGVTARATTWSKDWEAGFKQGSFAVTACPSWMLGIIRNNSGADNAGKWDVAAVPGGGGNWGGSWLAVPKQSKHPKEAAELAKFLTSAKSQVAAFKKAGPLPSNVKALDDPEFRAYKNEYFNNAPVGQIFGSGAKALKPVYLGPKHQAIKERAFEPALQSVEQGQAKPDAAWAKALADAKKEAR
ncbi:ABC transporter substrate-binding protein [Longispora albida]|uniref:ABC transporter substrate-binding protein n=1 Tax=Longispora albida TaxID=203523 RepID=UPI000373FCDE|nr:extracellular solute-binding protein [Longispora albida]